MRNFFCKVDASDQSGELQNRVHNYRFIRPEDICAIATARAYNIILCHGGSATWKKYPVQSRIQRGINRQIAACRCLSLWRKNTHGGVPVSWQHIGTQLRTRAYWPRAKQKIALVSLNRKTSSWKLRFRKERPWYIRQKKRLVALLRKNPLLFDVGGPVSLLQQVLGLRGMFGIASTSACVARTEDALRWSFCGRLTGRRSPSSWVTVECSGLSARAEP